MTFRENLTCLALLLLCACLAGTAVAVWRLPQIANRQADATRAALLAETQAFEKDANARLSDALGLLDRRTGEALATVSATANLANQRSAQALEIVGAAETDANAQLTRLNKTVTAQQMAITAALKPITETAQQVDDAAPLYLDCEFNPDCAFNRFQGTTKALETTAKVIAAEAPKIAAASVKVADSTASTGAEVVIAAKRFNAPQTKWQAFRTWVLVFGRLLGDFL